MVRIRYIEEVVQKTCSLQATLTLFFVGQIFYYLIIAPSNVMLCTPHVSTMYLICEHESSIPHNLCAFYGMNNKTTNWATGKAK